MAPIVDGLEQQYGDSVAFKRVNAALGDGPAIMEAYRIPGHPVTLIFDADGTETQRFIGPQPVDVVAAELDNVLDLR
jgi:thioredoxin-like negative regulator of GroEL